MVGRGGWEGVGGLGAEYDFRRNVPLPCTDIYIGVRKSLFDKNKIEDSNSTSCLVCDFFSQFSIIRESMFENH